MAHRPTERHIVQQIPEPGFYPLHLKIESGIEDKQINYLLGENDLELQSAPPCVHAAIINFKAVLMFSKHVFQRQAIEELKNLHENNPSNLNTLANLIYMCENSKRRLETKRYRDKFEELRNNKIEKARCLLEQGYALITDTHSETNETALKKVRDTKEILRQRKRNTPSGLRSGQITKQCLFADEFERLLMTTPEICAEETKKERQLSIQCFDLGLETLVSIKLEDVSAIENDEILVWKHYCGKAYNRVGGSGLTLATTTEKKTDLRKALNLFCEVINGLTIDEHTSKAIKICVGRTYAYLGHLLKTKQKIVSGVKEPAPDCLSDEKVCSFWTEPMKAFEKAEMLAGDDRVVLNRYGLTLKEDKQYQLAEGKFTKSLKVCSDFNWFAYTCRCQLYIDMYIDKFKTLEKERKDYKREKNGTSCKDADIAAGKKLLKKAEEDAEKCYALRTTTRILYDLAKINYYLGTDPFKVKSIKDHVTDKAKINQAIMHLQSALEYHECDYHSRIYAMLGKCLFSVGDRKDGIRNMKKAFAFEPSSVKDPMDFENLCRFLLQCYQIEKNESYPKKLYLLTELWIMLEEAIKKYKNRVKFQLIGITNSFPHEIFDLLKEVERKKIKSDHEAAKMVWDICLGALKKHNAPRVKKRANDFFPNDEFCLEEECGEETALEVVPAPEASLCKQKKYDFFISHSKKMAKWVQFFLLPILEDECMGNSFKGCFRQRKGDFDKTKTDEENVGMVLQDTKNVIIVVSKCYTGNEACMEECRRIIKYKTDRLQKDDGFIIPILRDAELPECLSFTEPADFIKYPYEITKLHSALCETTFYSCERNTVQSFEENSEVSEESLPMGQIADEAAHAENESYKEIHEESVMQPTDQPAEAEMQVLYTRKPNDASRDEAVQFAATTQIVTQKQPIGSLFEHHPQKKQKRDCEDNNDCGYNSIESTLSLTINSQDK